MTKRLVTLQDNHNNFCRCTTVTAISKALMNHGSAVHAGKYYMQMVLYFQRSANVWESVVTGSNSRHPIVVPLFISVINKLDVQSFCFTVSLFHTSTCFEHMCSSSGGHVLETCRGMK